MPEWTQGFYNIFWSFLYTTMISFVVEITEARVQILVIRGLFWQVTKFLSLSVIIGKWGQKNLLIRVTMKRTCLGRRHMDSSTVSIEETVAGDKDLFSEFKKKWWVYILELKILTICSLASHVAFFLTLVSSPVTWGSYPLGGFLEMPDRRGFIQ